MSTEKPTIQAGAKLGTLSNGAQRNHGLVIHALPISVGHLGHGMALCGAKPGRRSIGWGTDYPLEAISCEKCLKRVPA